MRPTHNSKEIGTGMSQSKEEYKTAEAEVEIADALGNLALTNPVEEHVKSQISLQKYFIATEESYQKAGDPSIATLDNLDVTVLASAKGIDGRVKDLIQILMFAPNPTILLSACTTFIPLGVFLEKLHATRLGFSKLELDNFSMKQGKLQLIRTDFLKFVDSEVLPDRAVLYGMALYYFISGIPEFDAHQISASQNPIFQTPEGQLVHKLIIDLVQTKISIKQAVRILNKVDRNLLIQKAFLYCRLEKFAVDSVIEDCQTKINAATLDNIKQVTEHVRLAEEWEREEQRLQAMRILCRNLLDKVLEAAQFLQVQINMTNYSTEGGNQNYSIALEFSLKHHEIIDKSCDLQLQKLLGRLLSKLEELNDQKRRIPAIQKEQSVQVPEALEPEKRKKPMFLSEPSSSQEAISTRREGNFFRARRHYPKPQEQATIHIQEEAECKKEFVPSHTWHVNPYAHFKGDALIAKKMKAIHAAQDAAKNGYGS